MDLIDQMRKSLPDRSRKMSLQEEIIAQLGVKPIIDPEEEIRKSVDFLKAYLKSTLFEKLCFGEFLVVRTQPWLAA